MRRQSSSHTPSAEVDRQLDDTAYDNVKSVATNITEVATVAGNLDAGGEVVTVGNDLELGEESTIKKVAAIDTNVSTVAVNSQDVIIVADNIDGAVSTDIPLVADNLDADGISGKVQIVADSIDDINALAVPEVVADMAALGDTTTKAAILALGDTDTEAALDRLNTGTTADNIDRLNTGDTADNVDIVALAADNVATVATGIEDVNNYADTYYGTLSVDPVIGTHPTLSEGDMYFHSSVSVKEMRVYDGDIWKAAGSTVNGTSKRESFISGTASGDYDGISLSTFPIYGGYDTGYIDVFVNGIKMNSDDVDTTSSPNIVFATDLTIGAEIDIVGYGTFLLADFYSKFDLDNGQLDNRYYTETEVDDILTAKEDAQLGAVGTITSPICEIDTQNGMNMKQGVGGISFERVQADPQSTTKEDKYGVLRYYDNDEPRYGDRGVAIEPTATNIIFPSTPTTSTDGWTIGGTTGFSYGATSPDGTANAFTFTVLQDDAFFNPFVRGSRFINNGNSFDLGTIGCHGAMYFKPTSEGVFQIAVRDDTNAIQFSIKITVDASLNCTYSDGNISTTNPTFYDYEVFDLSGGWKKAIVRMSTLTGSNVYKLAVGGGVLNSTMDFFLGEVKGGYVPTSSIPTTTGFVQRPNDLMYIQGRDNIVYPDNANGMAVLVDIYDIKDSTLNQDICSWYSNASSSFRILMDTSRRLRVFIEIGNITYIDRTLSVMPTGERHKIGVVILNDIIYTYLNNVLIDSSPALVTGLDFSPLRNAPIYFGSRDSINTANMQLLGFKSYNIAPSAEVMRLS